METPDSGPCVDRQATSSESATTSRFTIKALMFWTAVAAGAMPVAMTGAEYPPVGIFMVGAYLTVVCGIATLVRFPSSPDAWIPIVIALSLPALILAGMLFLPLGRPRDEFIQVLFLSGIPLGILFLVRNVLRIKRTGFSFTVFLYHFGVWLGWMGITIAIIAAPIT